MAAQPKWIDDAESDFIDMSEETLDQTLESILLRFEETHRLDHAHESMRTVLHKRLLSRGYSPTQLRLLEVNLFGSLSGWMQFMLEERLEGRDSVPDFARHLRRAFLAHCRELEIEPGVALNMAVELASALMEVATSFQRHLRLEEEDLSPDDEVTRAE